MRQWDTKVAEEARWRFGKSGNYQATFRLTDFTDEFRAEARNVG